MIALIILAVGKTHILPRVFEAVCAQQYQADVIAIVSDCSFDIPLCISDISIPIMVDDVSVFNAGKHRDLAITHLLNLHDIDLFVLLDGDCVPSPTFIKDHSLNIDSGYPTISCGYISRNAENGTPAIDARDSIFLSYSDGCTVYPWYFHCISSITWTGNIAFNRGVVDIARYVNGVLGYDGTRVFCSAFDGTWGAEDSFLGSAICLSGGCIKVTNRSCRVDHIWHPIINRSGHGKHKTLFNQLTMNVLNNMRQNKIPYNSGNIDDVYITPTLEGMFTLMYLDKPTIRAYADTLYGNISNMVMESNLRSIVSSHTNLIEILINPHKMCCNITTSDLGYFSHAVHRVIN